MSKIIEFGPDARQKLVTGMRRDSLKGEAPVRNIPTCAAPVRDSFQFRPVSMRYTTCRSVTLSKSVAPKTNDVLCLDKLCYKGMQFDAKELSYLELYRVRHGANPGRLVANLLEHCMVPRRRQCIERTPGGSANRRSSRVGAEAHDDESHTTSPKLRP